MSVIIDYKKQLNISLSSNVTTKQLTCVSTWITVGSKTNNIIRTTLSNKTPKIIVPTPAKNFDRELFYLKVINTDSVTANVLINTNSIDNSAYSNYNLNIISVLLSPDETLFYDKPKGFYILDYQGRLKPILNAVEVLSPDYSGVTNVLDYYTIIQSDLLLNNKSNTGHTHTIGSLSGVSVSTFNTYTANTTTQLSGVSTTNFNSHTGATNPHGTTIAQLSGVSTTSFNSFTANTQPAYGSLYEHNTTGTTIAVSSAGNTGWTTATDNTHALTSFVNNATADRITILSGGGGTYQINVICNVNFSNTTPIYSMGIYKNDVIIVQAQSSLSVTNTSDRHILSTNTLVSGVTANDYFDIRFTSNNATSRNMSLFHLTFNMNRIA